jgi:hypothetical protein
MKLTQIAVLAVLGAALPVPVSAQTAGSQGASSGSAAQPVPGQGMGSGKGMGPGQGMGPGSGGGKGKGFNFNQENTRGWELMTPEERTAHGDKMRATRTYEECKVLQQEHHKAMEVRAKEKGATLPVPRQNGCDRMKAGGFFK